MTMVRCRQCVRRGVTDDVCPCFCAVVSEPIVTPPMVKSSGTPSIGNRRENRLQVLDEQRFAALGPHVGPNGLGHLVRVVDALDHHQTIGYVGREQRHRPQSEYSIQQRFFHAHVVDADQFGLVDGLTENAPLDEEPLRGQPVPATDDA